MSVVAYNYLGFITCTTIKV